MSEADRVLLDAEHAWIVDLMATDLDCGFSCFVECYERYAYSVARSFVGSDDIDDIVQDAFLRAYIALKAYPLARIRALKARPWLRVIVKHAALNYCDFQKRHETLSVELFEESGQQFVGDKFETAESWWMRREIIEEINVWITDLIPRDRLILQLHYGLGNSRPYTLEFVSRELDMSMEAVKKRVQRALKRVRHDLMKKLGPTVLTELYNL